MATIRKYELKKGGTRKRDRERYLVIYRQPNGAQTTKRGFTAKRDAEMFVSTVEVSKAAGEYVRPSDGRVTVGSLADAWLDKKQATLKHSSWAPLDAAWRNHVEPRWGGVKLADVQPSDVEAWAAGLAAGGDGRKPLGATMVVRCHSVLSGILDDAVRDRRIARNPAAGISLPRKQSKPHVYLSHGQVRALADASDRAALVLTLAYTGIRWSEAAGLQVKNVDFERRRLTIARNMMVMGARIEATTPKGREARSVPFPAFLAAYLRPLCDGRPDEAEVFTEPGGGVLRRSHHRAGWFEHAVRDAGIPRVTPHDLRHSAAGFAVSAGANVKVVQRMLGHKSAAMTLDVYADLFDRDLDDVATALDAAVHAAWGQA